MLNEFLLQLAKDLNVPSFPPSDDGSYMITFDPKIEISLRENSDSGITLHTKIGACAPKALEELYLKLMKANLLGKETGEALLGLTKERNEVTLTTFFVPGQNAKEIREGLEDFVNYAESWRREVATFAELK